ncbi:4-hydroxyphenylacetate 3-hydroxylase C-terminal domain-containing protein [Cupriavidus basilensis]
MCEANGFDPGEESHLRDQMVELIKITEGFTPAASPRPSMPRRTPAAQSFVPDPVFANIGKLLLATQIYDMHKIAHHVSGGLMRCAAGPRRRSQAAHRGNATGCPAGQSRCAVRQTHRDGPVHRRPDGVLSGAAGTRSSACMAAARRKR